MELTMYDGIKRFNARSGAIVFNKDKSKILLEKQWNMYLFPGGRIDMMEDSQTTIKREIKEELNIDCIPTLKYIVEMQAKEKYHEIGFYYILTIEENQIKNMTKNADGDGIFLWIDINELEKYFLIMKLLIEEIKNKSYEENSIKYLSKKI